MDEEVDLMLRYHEETKHSEISVRFSGHRLDWPNKPSPFKFYRGLPALLFPNDFPRPGGPSILAIRGASSERFSGTFDVRTLAELLFFSGGLTRKITSGGDPYYMRAASATGALYPIELYVVCKSLSGLEPGVYHFNPLDFALVKLRDGDYRKELALACGEEEVTWPVAVVLTSLAWKNAWKYEARSYRHWFWDSGVIAANLLATSASEGLTTELALGFVDSEVERLLRLEKEREAPVAVAHVGVGLSERTEQSQNQVTPLAVPLETPFKGEVDYPEIWRANTASSFDSPAQARKWRESSLLRVPEVHESQTSIPLSSTVGGSSRSPPLEKVILSRGSTRRFAKRSISFEALSMMIDSSAADIPLDFLSSERTLVDFYLIVHAVEGLASGSYFCNRETRALEPLKAGEFRVMSAYLCLEQPLFGTASVVFYLMADLRQVMGTLGSRGYRAAQFEAGLRAGRIYLSSYSMGIGASGSTFYDDAVSEFFSPHAKEKSTMIAVGVGIPAYRARPGAILPQRMT